MTLLAPAASARALLGRGEADVDGILDWERADLAALFTGVATRELRDELAAFDIALVYSRSFDLARSLAAVIPRVLSHDPTPAHGHASAWLAKPLGELGIDARAPAPPCEPSPGELASGAALARMLPPRFLAVHPGSGSLAKNWPAERFAAVVARLSPQRPWLLVEGPADAAAAGSLACLPGMRLARCMPPRALGALLGQAGAYLGNDSAVSHLAAAWGAPTLALFGPTDPGMWAPLGPRVRVLRSPTAALADIPIEAALAALTELAAWAAR